MSFLSRTSRYGPGLVYASLLAAISAQAQVNVDDQLQSSDIASGYASIINFAVEPDVTAARLEIETRLPEDPQLEVMKFPLRHEFQPTENGWIPIVQATLGRLTLKADFPVLTNGVVRSKWTAYSATLGGGVRIPLSEKWSLLPAGDAGYAYLENDAAYSTGVAVLEPVLRGKLLDWTAHAWLANAHLSIIHTNRFRDLSLKAWASGTLSYIHSFDTNSEFQDFSETVGTVSLKAEALHPLGISLWHHPLDGVLQLGHNTLLTHETASLGFKHLNEVGFTLQMNIQRDGLHIKQAGFGAMVLFGDHVTGWKLLYVYRF